MRLKGSVVLDDGEEFENPKYDRTSGTKAPKSATPLKAIWEA